MAQITYHSERGEKSALVMYKETAFQFAGVPVYIPRSSWSNAKAGDIQEIPAMTLVDIVDTDTGEVRVTKTGEPLKMFAGVK